MSALCFVCVSTRLDDDLGGKSGKKLKKKRVGCGERVVGYFFFTHCILSFARPQESQLPLHFSASCAREEMVGSMISSAVCPHSFVSLLHLCPDQDVVLFVVQIKTPPSVCWMRMASFFCQPTHAPDSRRAPPSSPWRNRSCEPRRLP